MMSWRLFWYAVRAAAVALVVAGVWSWSSTAGMILVGIGLILTDAVIHREGDNAKPIGDGE